MIATVVILSLNAYASLRDRAKGEIETEAAFASLLSHPERKKILVPAIRSVSPVTNNNQPSTISFHP
jgi:hypothetical protein